MQPGWFSEEFEKRDQQAEADGRDGQAAPAQSGGVSRRGFLQSGVVAGVAAGVAAGGALALSHQQAHA